MTHYVVRFWDVELAEANFVVKKTLKQAEKEAEKRRAADFGNGCKKYRSVEVAEITVPGPSEDPGGLNGSAQGQPGTGQGPGPARLRRAPDLLPGAPRRSGALVLLRDPGPAFRKSVRNCPSGLTVR